MHDYFCKAVGNIMSSEKVLKKYGIKLCKTLPMDDPIFLIMLENQDILPGDSRDKIETQKTKIEKADYYFRQVIKTSADLYLPKLLQAMEQYYKEYNDNVLKELGIHMIAEMKSKFGSSLFYKMCT